MPVELTTYVAAKDREGHEVMAFAYSPKQKLRKRRRRF